MKPKLQILVASTRPGRAGLPVARWFQELAVAHGGFDVEIVDLAKWNLPLVDEPNHPRLHQYTHEHTKRWSEQIASADAFVFVMPEYNYGFNAPLKNALDYLYQEWQYKPVGFVSYGGISGGLRAVQMIKQVVTTLKMVPVTEAVAIHFVQQHLKNGQFQANEGLDHATKTMLDEIQKVEAALRPLRAPSAAKAG